MTTLDPTIVYRMQDGCHPDSTPRYCHYAFNPSTPDYLECESGGLLPFGERYLSQLEPTTRSMDEFQQVVGRKRKHLSAVGAWCDSTGIYD
jgi:hypothetical protein